MGLQVASRLCRLPFLLSVAILCALPIRAQDASEIVRKSVAVNDRDFKAQPQYSFRERDLSAKLDAGGKPKTQHSKTLEVTMIDGSPYSRLTELNGEPLPSSEEQVEAAKLKAAQSQRASQSTAQRQARISKYQKGRANDHMLMQEMVKAFDFTIAGNEQINGHDCYKLNANPKPGYQPPVEKARVLTGMKGTMWIAKDGYHWVRVEAEVIHPVEFGYLVAKVNPGTTFELDQAPVGGAWLPQHFVQTVNARVLGMFGLASRDEAQYSDYQRLGVQQAAAELNHTH